jgi:subtilisin family serine protease
MPGPFLRGRVPARVRGVGRGVKGFAMKRSAWGMMLAVLLIAAAAAWAEPYVPILLGDTQFDPKCAEPAEVRQARSALAASTSGGSAASSAYTSTIAPGRLYYVVQFQGPVRSEWKRQVGALGGVFVAYVPRYAFAVRMTSTEAAQVAALPFVRWVGPFPAQWKYRRSLVADRTRGVTLLVSLFPGELLDRVCTYIKDHNLWYLGFAWTPNPAIRMHAPASAVTDLAALPEVLWIQEYKNPKPTNSMGQRFLNISNIAGLSWGVDTWNDYHLFGTGQIVGIADTGLDSGELDNLHPDFLDANGNPRVVAVFPVATGDFWGDYVGHGTHVAGSVLGNGTMSGGDPTTSSYTGSFAGMAPEAKVVFQSLGPSGQFVVPLDWTNLFGQSFEAGARIHTNSWGYSYYFGEYSYESFMVDDYMWRHPEMTILYAAGNDGIDTNWHGIIDPNSIGQPATAKDCVTVGATESFRPPFAGWKGVANYTWGNGLHLRQPGRHGGVQQPRAVRRRADQARCVRARSQHHLHVVAARGRLVR